jgi:predicted DNA-binding transcriptional regulator YafY
MLDTSARLLRLLSILQRRPEWSGAELAERLHVTVRTLRRDVVRLRELGYPVEASPGVADGQPHGDLPWARRRAEHPHRRTVPAGAHRPPVVSGLRQYPRGLAHVPRRQHRRSTRAGTRIHTPRSSGRRRLRRRVHHGGSVPLPGPRRRARPGLALHLALLGHEFTVLEPPELVDELSVLARGSS